MTDQINRSGLMRKEGELAHGRLCGGVVFGRPKADPRRAQVLNDSGTSLHTGSEARSPLEETCHTWLGPF